MRKRTPVTVVLVATAVVGVAGVAALGGALLQPGPTPTVAATDPRAIVVGENTASIGVDPDSGHILVVNNTTVDSGMAGGSVSIIDSRTRRVVGTVPVGVNPGAVTVDARTHRAYVLNAGMSVTTSVRRGGTYRSTSTPLPGSVSVLDTRDGRIVRTLTIGGEPRGLAVDARTGHLFVADAARNTVSMFVADTGVLVRRVAVGRSPVGIAVDARTGHVFVVNQGSGTVSMLDARSSRTVRTIPVGNIPARIAADPGTGHIFVGNMGSGSVSVLDARSGTVVRTSALGGVPADVVVDAPQHHVFVLTQSGNPTGPGGVTMLDAGSGQVVRTVVLGTFAVGIAADEGRGRVVVTTGGAIGRDGYPTGRGQAHVLDGGTGHVLRTLAVGLASYNVAVDGRTGQAFVANSGGPISTRAESDGLGRVLPFLAQRVPQPQPVPASVSVIDVSR